MNRVHTIALWVVVGIALTALAGVKSYSVTTDDTAQFLPKGSQSAQALRYGQQAFGLKKGTSTVTVLVQRADGGRLTAGDRSQVRALVDRMDRWRPDLDALSGAADGIDVAGRAGRSPLGGQVILQTFMPDHYALQSAAGHDYHGFFEKE